MLSIVIFWLLSDFWKLNWMTQSNLISQARLKVVCTMFVAWILLRKWNLSIKFTRWAEHLDWMGERSEISPVYRVRLYFPGKNNVNIIIISYWVGWFFPCTTNDFNKSEIRVQIRGGCMIRSNDEPTYLKNEKPMTETTQKKTDMPQPTIAVAWRTYGGFPFISFSVSKVSNYSYERVDRWTGGWSARQTSQTMSPHTSPVRLQVVSFSSSNRSVLMNMVCTADRLVVNLPMQLKFKHVSDLKRPNGELVCCEWWFMEYRLYSYDDRHEENSPTVCLKWIKCTWWTREYINKNSTGKKQLVVFNKILLVVRLFHSISHCDLMQVSLQNLEKKNPSSFRWKELY